MEGTEYNEAMKAGAALSDASRADHDAIPFIVVPRDYEMVRVEETLPAPIIKRANVDHDELTSFAEFVNLFKSEATRLFVHLETQGGKVLAIFDYHAPGKPSWCNDRASYTPKYTPEWLRWAYNNEKSLSQVSFCEFVEDNLAQISEPEGAKMLEVARNLTAKKTVNFKSGVRLDNGDEQLQFEETTEAKAGEKGTIKVPSELVLAVAPFQNGPVYQVNANLRYRITDGKLTFHYKLMNVEKIIQAAMREIVGSVEKATGIKPFMAIP